MDSVYMQLINVCHLKTQLFDFSVPFWINAYGKRLDYNWLDQNSSAGVIKSSAFVFRFLLFLPWLIGNYMLTCSLRNSSRMHEKKRKIKSDTELLLSNRFIWMLLPHGSKINENFCYSTTLHNTVGIVHTYISPL